MTNWYYSICIKSKTKNIYIINSTKIYFKTTNVKQKYIYIYIMFILFKPTINNIYALCVIYKLTHALIIFYHQPCK